MKKWLAILAVAFASVGFLSAKSVPLSTPEKRITEAGIRQSRAADTHSQSGNSSSNNAPSASPQPSSPTCDEACQQARQNLDIQRKLEWFTGGLVFVGFLQVGTMIWQAVLLRRTRDEVHDQAGWMKTQSGHMEAQTEILSDSVAIAQKSADAAEKSAQAAIGISAPVLVLHKLSLNRHPGGTLKNFYKYPDFRIEVKNFGQSPAFLKAYTLDIAAGDLPEEPVYPESWQVDMQEVVDAGSTYLLGGEEGRISTRNYPNEETVGALCDGKELIVFGYVTYGDVFGSPLRTMKFSKIMWEMSESNLIPPLMMDWGGPNYTGQHEAYSRSQKPN